MASGAISFRRYLARRHYQAGYPGSAGNGALVVRRASGATLPLARSRLYGRYGWDFPAATVTLPDVEWEATCELDGSNPSWVTPPHQVPRQWEVRASSGARDFGPVLYRGGDCSSPAWFGDTGFLQPYWGPRGALPAGIPDGYCAGEGLWSYYFGIPALGAVPDGDGRGSWCEWYSGLWLHAAAPRHRLFDPDGLVLRLEPAAALASLDYPVDDPYIDPDSPEGAAMYAQIDRACEAASAGADAVLLRALGGAWASITLSRAERVTDYRNFGNH